MAYDNTNKGSLSKNEKKNSDKHPDYKGSANIEGTEYWISGWIRKGQNGTFLSLAFEEKNAQGSGNKRQQSRNAGSDGDMPF